MNFFEKEMREMFGQCELLRDSKFCGKMMIAKLDEDLRLKLQFVTMGYADNYEAIKHGSTSIESFIWISIRRRVHG